MDISSIKVLDQIGSTPNMWDGPEDEHWTWVKSGDNDNGAIEKKKIGAPFWV